MNSIKIQTNKNLINTLYTVQRIRKDGTLYGLIHGSTSCEITICEKQIDHNWYVLNNTFDGEIICKRCLKILKEKFYHELP